MYALILAGGRGERLRPHTDTVAKPMVPVCGKPILWYQVQWLKRGGVTDIVFLAGYHWESIKNFFGDGSEYDFYAHYSIEDTPLGRGGAIRKGMALVPGGEEYVVVTNGDIITSESLSGIVDEFRRRREGDPTHQATMMVVPLLSPYGLVDISSEGDVKNFREKVQLPYWINAGIYVLSRGIENALPELGDHEDSTFPDLAAKGKLEPFVLKRSGVAWTPSRTFARWRNI